MCACLNILHFVGESKTKTVVKRIHPSFAISWASGPAAQQSLTLWHTPPHCWGQTPITGLDRLSSTRGGSFHQILDYSCRLQGAESSAVVPDWDEIKRRPWCWVQDLCCWGSSHGSSSDMKPRYISTLLISETLRDGLKNSAQTQLQRN